MEKKTLQERWDEEVLSDNTQIENCKQCKSCEYQDGGTPFSNHYTKSSCQMYAYPKMKPIEVIDNEGDCPYFSLIEK
jgi:hypothetical protein